MVCPRIAAALWGGFLLVVTSWPHPPVVEAGGLPLDKVTHFGLYGVGAFLLDRAISWKGRRRFAWTRVLTIGGTLALFGALDEAHQEWIPGRRMDTADLAADITGATVGALIAGIARPRGRSSVAP